MPNLRPIGHDFESSSIIFQGRRYPEGLCIDKYEDQSVRYTRLSPKIVESNIFLQYECGNNAGQSLVISRILYILTNHFENEVKIVRVLTSQFQYLSKAGEHKL